MTPKKPREEHYQRAIGKATGADTNVTLQDDTRADLYHQDWVGEVARAEEWSHALGALLWKRLIANRPGRLYLLTDTPRADLAHIARAMAAATSVAIQTEVWRTA